MYIHCRLPDRIIWQTLYQTQTFLILKFLAAVSVYIYSLFLSQCLYIKWFLYRCIMGERNWYWDSVQFGKTVMGLCWNQRNGEDGENNQIKKKSMGNKMFFMSIKGQYLALTVVWCGFVAVSEYQQYFYNHWICLRWINWMRGSSVWNGLRITFVALDIPACSRDHFFFGGWVLGGWWMQIMFL